MSRNEVVRIIQLIQRCNLFHSVCIPILASADCRKIVSTLDDITHRSGRCGLF